MSGPGGTIIVNGNREITMECEEGDATYAEAACVEEELNLYKLQVDPGDMTSLKKPTVESELKFKSVKDTKQVVFTPGDSFKQFTIGAHMSEK